MRLFQNLSSLQLSLPFAASLFLFAAGVDESPQGREPAPQGEESAVQDTAEEEATESKWILRPTTSDRSLEEQFSEFLTEVHDYESEIHEFTQNPDDVYLAVGSTANELPSIEVLVDAIPLAGDETEVTKMRVELVAFFSTGVGKDHPKRLRMLEVLNDYNMSVWGVTRVFLDSDGDLRLDSNVLVPESEHGVHCSVVFDHIVDIVDTWNGVGALLKEAGLPYGN
ncbi:MAG: hypothetical protein AAF196_04295 [Planctomycetota bacterium]